MVPLKSFSVAEGQTGTAQPTRFELDSVVRNGEGGWVFRVGGGSGDGVVLEGGAGRRMGVAGFTMVAVGTGVAVAVAVAVV